MSWESRQRKPNQRSVHRQFLWKTAQSSASVRVDARSFADGRTSAHDRRLTGCVCTFRSTSPLSQNGLNALSFPVQVFPPSPALEAGMTNAGDDTDTDLLA